MRIGVVGINHKLADLTLRERLAKTCQRRFSSDRSMHGEKIFVVLSTCNRTEIYFYSEDLAESHSYLLAILRQDVAEDFDQKLYSYFGYDCFLHLCRVTAGMDSAIVAETEIQGQVKSAYENAATFSSLPYELHYLFQKSLKIGKQIRAGLPLKPGLPDIEDAILNTGRQVFKHPQKAKILCVGASEINLKVIAFLQNKQCHNITLCNRTADHANSIAEQHQLDLLEWDSMKDWHQFDWIIFGTKSPEYLLKQEHLTHKNISQKLIIDLCVPRNVDPDVVNQCPSIKLLNIDQINRSLKIRRQRMITALYHAENLLVDAAKLHIDLYMQREQNRFKFVCS